MTLQAPWEPPVSQGQKISKCPFTEGIEYDSHSIPVVLQVLRKLRLRIIK